MQQAGQPYSAVPDRASMMLDSVLDTMASLVPTKLDCTAASLLCATFLLVVDLACAVCVLHVCNMYVQVVYLADGIPGLIGSPIGGMLSDRSAAKHPTEPEARLVHNTLIALITVPSGLLIFAWALHAKVHLVGILAAMALNAFGCGAYLPGLFGYLTTLKQSAAAAASAAIQSLMFVMSGVMILVSAVATRTLGFGLWFSLLAGIQLVVTLLAYISILRKQHSASRRGDSQALPASGAAHPASQQPQGAHAV